VPTPGTLLLPQVMMTGWEAVLMMTDWAAVLLTSLAAAAPTAPQSASTPQNGIRKAPVCVGKKTTKSLVLTAPPLTGSWPKWNNFVRKSWSKVFAV